MMLGVNTITIDEKGRFLFPNKMRKIMENGEYVLTYGVEKCLQIMSLTDFESMKTVLLKDANPMLNKHSRELLRRFIAPAIEVNLDKAGRLNIPRALRDGVGLFCKTEGVILDSGPFFEIWSNANYRIMNDNLDIEEASSALFNIMNKESE